MLRLVSTHKSSIQCVATFQSKGVPWEQLIVGHSYGSLASWEPFSRGLSGVGGEMVCRLDCKVRLAKGKGRPLQAWCGLWVSSRLVPHLLAP